MNHAKNIFLQFLKQKKNQPDNGTYFEIGVAVLFQAAVFAFQGYQVYIREDMNARWIEAIGKIDGAMLLDQYGKLYMVGVILDGEIPAKGVNTSRGARYNSEVKYSYSHKKEKHLLVVISEDGYFDVINYNWLL